MQKLSDFGRQDNLYSLHISDVEIVKQSRLLEKLDEVDLTLIGASNKFSKMTQISYFAIASSFSEEPRLVGKRYDTKPRGNSRAHFGDRHVEKKGASEYEGQEAKSYTVF